MRTLNIATAIVTSFTLIGCVEPYEQVSGRPDQRGKAVAGGQSAQCKYDKYGAPIYTYKDASGRTQINRSCPGQVTIQANRAPESRYTGFDAPPPSSYDYNEERPLFDARFWRNATPKVIKATLSNSDLEARYNGKTALMAALEMRRFGAAPLAAQQLSDVIVKNLLDAGADFNAIDSDDWSVLMIAVSQTSVNAVKMLLDKGVNIHAKNYRGETALMFAANRPLLNNDTNAYAKLQILQLLIDAGANVNVKNPSGRTALYFARNFGSPLQVQMLKNNGAR